MGYALSEVFTGVFSVCNPVTLNPEITVCSFLSQSSDDLWEQLRSAGESEYDRFWRMPLDDEFGFQIHSSNADLQNTGGRPAGSITAALFLKPFVNGLEGDEPSIKWAHLDIAGSMDTSRPGPYQEKGMTGRPVRALVEFASRLAN